MRREDLAWPSDLPSFYIFNLDHEMDDKKSGLVNDCKEQFPEAFCSFLFEAPARVHSGQEADIFLVPIFQSALYAFEGLHQTIKDMRHHRYFLRFRGSDFVFVCYVKDCASVQKIVQDGLGVGTRAIWVDRGANIPWPCENRKIVVQSETASDVNNGLHLDFVKESIQLAKVIEVAADLVKARSRYSCSKRNWGMVNASIFDFGTVKDTSFKSVKDKVAYCGVPKVGSSVAVLLMRRMNDMNDWKKSNTVQIRNFNTGYNWTYKSADDMRNIFDRSDWVKGMLVRDPVTRLLSGYRDKVEALREYYRIPGGWPSGANPPTLAQFVARMQNAKKKGNFDWTDRHFRPQSALCGVRTLPYDFIGRYEDRTQDMHDFLKSLDLWEKLGESGWGPDGQSSLYAEDEHIIRVDKPKPVTHADSRDIVRQYYTPELVKVVIQLYDEDFTRFGFSKNVEDYI